MMDFIYPIREGSPSWGYPTGVIETFGSMRSVEVHDWYLGNARKLVEVGHRLWIYASQPEGRIVGQGLPTTIRTGPTPMAAGGFGSAGTCRSPELS
jgi:hypothetical protein